MGAQNGFWKSWLRGIKGRLLLAAVFPLLGFIVLGGLTYRNLDDVVKLLDQNTDSIVPSFDALGEMRQARNKFLYNVWASFATEAPEQRAKFIKGAHEAIEEFESAEKQYSQFKMSQEEVKLYATVKDLLPDYYKNTKQVITLLESGDPKQYAEAKLVMQGPLSKIGTEIRAWNRDLAKQLRKTAEASNAAANASKAQAVQTIIRITTVAGLAIFGLMIFIGARIANSVGGISDKIDEANKSVVSAVEQLSLAGNSLSQSSTSSAASLEETVASLEELTSMVRMNSDNAKQAASLSVSSRETAEKGEHEIQSLIRSMQNISQSSKKIEEIISVIDDIAFQTNLLALNAAVEAARAGEQGKGFAVVAEAVRSLAQRSAAAAKDITSLIQDSVTQVEEGRRIADNSGTVLSNITSSVKKVSDLNNEISVASSEQTTGIQQISKAMNQLDQSSQGNAASAEEIAATTVEINGLAQTTQVLLSDLQRFILGRSVKAESVQMEVPKKKSVASIQKKDALPQNVVKLKTPAKATRAAATIPFDEDQEVRAKVGTTEGF
ncbi:MAG: chemotaxis protein [Bdellovibrio sp. ArHS]|uniref:methyl-accepting chemotaxis protein n=1 Tax=Bdellovibrio sp. ArHS TaxID=1569284 RepID=UPI0005827340|nr:methyl-accepting chemotaxis protein [Bdellovibrio sp. ArHS]KHD87147.1 MAG: chemotaxis protein [Bdellovibrio sp. ArHS]